MGIWERGFWTIGRVRGAPIRIHWSTPLGAFFFGRFDFVPGFWLGFLLLIIIHELGHAFVVWRARATVVSIDLLPFGGLCHWSGYVSKMQRATIAWGGVLAQLLLWITTFITLEWSGRPQTAFGLELAHAFTRTNLWLVLINLMPIPPLDGANAWPLLPMLGARLSRKWRSRQSRRAAQRETKMRAELEVQMARVDELEGELDPELEAKLDESLSRVFGKRESESEKED